MRGLRAFASFARHWGHNSVLLTSKVQSYVPNAEGMEVTEGMEVMEVRW